MVDWTELLAETPRASFVIAENLMRTVSEMTSDGLDRLASDLHSAADRVRRGAALPPRAPTPAGGEEPPDYLYT